RSGSVRPPCICPSRRAEPGLRVGGEAVHARGAGVVRPGLELTRPEARVSLRADAGFGTGQFGSVTLKGTSMRMFGCFVVAAGLLTAAPAMAGPYGNGGGYTNIWSSAQGTSNSYGQASGIGTSAAGAAATAGGGRGTHGFHRAG